MAQKKMSIYTITAIGLMSALVFVASHMSINIPTALGNTRLHFGNIFCLLSGMLLGGLQGGLSAGIGSMFFDLTNPLYISSAPITFCTKFLMAWLCGIMTKPKDGVYPKLPQMMLGATSGAVFYVFLYVSQSFITSYFFMRNAFETVVASLIQKGTVSLFNALMAVVASLVLIPSFRAIYKKSGMYDKLMNNK